MADIPRGAHARAGQTLSPVSGTCRVAPVTRGTRYAAFFWVQSFIRRDIQRRILLELDTAIQQLPPPSRTNPHWCNWLGFITPF